MAKALQTAAINSPCTIESVLTSFQQSELCLIHASAWNGEVGALMLLHSLGFDVNQRNDLGETAAHFAAGRGHAKVLRVLRELGANLGAVTAMGTTPAHWAAVENKVEALKALSEAGVDLEKRNHDGKTPLDWAARNGRREAIHVIKQLLLDANRITGIGTGLATYPDMASDMSGRVGGSVA